MISTWERPVISRFFVVIISMGIGLLFLRELIKRGGGGVSRMSESPQNTLGIVPLPF